jgi:hypothetical protein
MIGAEMDEAPTSGLDEEVRVGLAEAASAYFSAHSGTVRSDPEQSATAARETLRLAGGLGLLATHVADGDTPGQLVYAATVAECAGRELVHPLLLHHLAALCYLPAVDESDELQADIISGTSPVLLAWRESPTVADVTIPGGLVPADAVLLHTAGEGVAVLRPGQFDIVATQEPWRSPASALAKVHLTGGGAVERLDAPDPERALAVAAALGCVYVLGGCRRLLELTVAYAMNRRQFGVPIGSFQSIKHRLADADIGLHHARALAFGALSAATVSGTARNDVWLTKIHTSRVATHLAETCLQVHGGFGFTWESDVHLYLKMFVDLEAWPVPRTAVMHRLWRDLASHFEEMEPTA